MDSLLEASRGLDILWDSERTHRPTDADRLITVPMNPGLTEGSTEDCLTYLTVRKLNLLKYLFVPSPRLTVILLLRVFLLIIPV